MAELTSLRAVFERAVERLLVSLILSLCGKRGLAGEALRNRASPLKKKFCLIIHAGVSSGRGQGLL